MTSIPPRILPLLCLTCLTNSVQAAPIDDDARMFQAAAIDQAQQGIADIHQSFHYGLFVRTIATASSDPSRWLPKLRTPRINRMLQEQARSFADESGTPGIYVLICHRPLDVHIVVRSEGNADLSRHDAESLRQSMMRDLHDKDADAALLALVDRVQEMLQDHVARGASPVVNGIVLGSLLGGGVILWLLLRLVRRRIRAGKTGDQETLSRERPALLGAMFGFPAGLWIYDKLCPCSPIGNGPEA